MTQDKRARANGVDLAYEVSGPEGRETVLLIPGVDQIEDRSRSLTRALVERGYRVVTYDSRDAGTSTHFDRAGEPDWRAIHQALVEGTAPPVAYTSRDLAADAVGLLDALGICRAHIVGGSLGGIVAQIVAADYPDRVLSLTSISSSTGNPGLLPGPASALVSSPVEAADPQTLFEHQIKVARALESPAYRSDEATLRARVAQQLKRPQHPGAVARQGAAATVAGDRRSRLRHIGVPTMVIHGDADQLFPLEHGRDTAANIPGAQFLVIAGMGHDLPGAVTSTVADAIASVARRGRERMRAVSSEREGCVSFVRNDRASRRWSAMLTLSLTLLSTPSRSAFAQETQPSNLPPGWSAPAGFVPEPALLRKLVNSTDGVARVDGEPGDGPYVELGHMITGAGWLSAGPGYRHHLLRGNALVDVSAAVSWNVYKAFQGRFELPRLAHGRLILGAQAMYQDLLQVDYFGLGNGSSREDRSAYRLNNIDALGYARVRATAWLSIKGRAGWIPAPDLSTATGRNVTVPNTIDRFSEESAPGLRVQPAFVHADVSVEADSRDYPGHPSRGGLYRASAATYSDRDGGMHSFRRYEVEASQFVPLFTRRWILALHGWEVFSSTSDGQVVPFYLMPSLGGQNTLRGYEDYRFHDADLQSFNVESRWALFTHVDAAAFVDVGKVAPLAGDLDYTHMKHSYGVGLRVHDAASTLVRLDVGHGDEGWHVFLKLTDSFKRSTPAYGRSSVMPFVP